MRTREAEKIAFSIVWEQSYVWQEPDTEYLDELIDMEALAKLIVKEIKDFTKPNRRRIKGERR